MANLSNSNHTNASTNSTGYFIREDSDLEVALYLTSLLPFTVFILGGNISLITVMAKFNNLLQPCNRLIRICIALGDIMICITSANLLIVMLVFKIKTATMFCVINSKIVLGSVLMSMALSSLLAVERYIYIVKPLKYSRWVTKPRVLLCIFGIMTLLSITYTVNYWRFNTIIRISSFLCIGEVKNPWLFISFILLTFVICVCVTLALYLFLKKKIGDSSSNTAGADGLITRKAIKLIVLLSGSLLLTNVPSYLARFAILRTWKVSELEAGANVTVLTLVRITSMSMSLLSSTANPICQFVIEKDLIVGLKKILGKRAYFSWQREIIAAVNTRVSVSKT